jgi:tetratricopeptide (TPR) repeat protein
MRRLLSISALLIAALSIAHAPVFAKEPTKEEQAAAKAHFDEAQKQYKLGRFEEAFGEYQAAYELAPFADLLFNMGQCKRNLKDYERALFFFKAYVRDAPRAEDRDRVNQLIAQLEAERAREAKMVRPVETSTAALPRVGTATSTPQPIVVVMQKPPKESDPIYREWWFWTAIIVAAAGVAGGVIVATRDAEAALPSGSLGRIDGRE